MGFTRAIAVTFVATLAAPALAGGISWPFVVESVSSAQTEGSTLVVLRPSTTGPDFPAACSKLRVATRFSPEPFWRRTWSGEVVSGATHAEAIEFLKRAAAHGEPIRFGSMGNGLSPVGADPCSVQSRGLAILEEHGGGNAVYSFHDPI